MGLLYGGPMDGELFHRVREASDRLTHAERRVADWALNDLRSVAFGTVADAAEKSGASGASVIRLAMRLGYDGFSDMQAAVQEDLSRRLSSATQRIRQPAAGDVVDRALSATVQAVQATVDRVERGGFDRAVELISNPDRSVWLVGGDESTGVVQYATDRLSMLRSGVCQLGGNPVAVDRQLVNLRPGDVLVALDIRRYDRWVVSTVENAVGRGAVVVSLTDGALSPLAGLADELLVVECPSVGPFDSYVGAVAVLDALIASVAARSTDDATPRLDELENRWSESGALSDD